MKLVAACSLPWLPFASAVWAADTAIVLSSPDSAIPATQVSLPTVDALAAAVRISGEETVYLVGVEDCVRLALGESRAIRIASIRALAAGNDVQIARGFFDPGIFGLVSARHGDTARRGGGSLGAGGLLSRLLVSDIDSEVYTAAAGLTGITPTGTRYRVEWSTVDAHIAPPFPARDADTAADGAVFSVVQPLLRGVGVTVNRANVRKARAAREAADAAHTQTQQEIVAAALTLYWNLVGLSESLTVQEAAVRTSERLLDDTVARRELGAGSDLDVLTAKSGLARRQNDYIETFAALGAVSDQLKELLDLREGDALLPARVVPAESATAIDVAALDLDQPLADRISAALTRRPEVVIEDRLEDIERIDLRVRRNDRLPTLDLYGRVELANRTEESTARRTTTLDQDDTQWEAGLEASYALGNRSARAAYQRAQHAVAAQEEQREATRTKIMRELSDAVRQTQKSITLLENADKTVELERARFEAEEARYQFGESTPFQVLLVQDNLIAEQTRRAVAGAGLQAAVVELRRAEGTLLASFAPGA